MLLSLHTKPQKSTQQAMRIKKKKKKKKKKKEKKKKKIIKHKKNK